MIPLLRTIPLVLAMLVIASLDARAQWNPRPENGGVALGTSLYADPAVCPDANGGAFVTWCSSTGRPLVQRLDAFGTAMWTPGGLEVGSVSSSFLRVVADGSGGAIFAWANDGTGSNRAIRVQRGGSSGALAWTSGGVVISSAVTSKKSLAAVADGAGGVFVAWAEAVVHGSSEDPPLVRVQHVNAAGTVLWGASGLRPSTLAGEQVSPSLVRDGADGIIVTWSDSRIGGAQVYAQRYNASGTALWTANGVAAAPSGSGQDAPVAVSDGAGGAIVAWTGSGDIRAQRYAASGVLQWAAGGIAVCSAANSQGEPAIASDAAGGAVIAWTDARSANADVYAQRVNASGTAQWAANGIGIATGSRVQQRAAISADAAGNVTIAWNETRPSSSDAIFAQRLDGSGSPQWWEAGLPVSFAQASALGSAVAADASGAVFVAWLDMRDFSATRTTGIQRIDAAGVLGNPAPRILSIRDVPQDQGHQLKVTWAASALDTTELDALAGYRVERWDGSGWTLMMFPPAGAFANYSAVVATLADSTSPSSPFVRIRVRAVDVATPVAHTWDSAPDSARSHDDLAPAPPLLAGEVVAGATHLSWRAACEPDVASYRVYRGYEPGFATDARALVAETHATSWSEPAGRPAYWKVCARDAGGNESAPAAWSPPGAIIAPEPGPSFAFAAPTPSPAAERTVFAFTLPATGRAALRLYDVSGREVRALADGVLPAGSHACAWDLRDARGRAVPVGAYFARLAFGGEVRTQRVLVVH